MGRQLDSESPVALRSFYGELADLFADGEVEEIWINEPGRVFAARHGRSELTSVVLDSDRVQALVERWLAWSGRRLDVSVPFVDAPLPDGSRLHVVIPEITRDWSVNVRKFIARATCVEDLVQLGSITLAGAAYLRACVVAGHSILVAGGTQSGKTTMINALLGCVPASQRIVSCEETFEINPAHHPDWVGMQTRQAGFEGSGGISLRQLVRETLRMRPSRLVIGEVRQAEALELLIAMNSGIPAMATIHANSARDAISKLCLLPLLAGENISADFVVPTVASCVDTVVHLDIDVHGRRGITSIASPTGRTEAGVVEMAHMFDRVDGQLRRSEGWPDRQPFERVGIDLERILGVADERWGHPWSA